MDQILKKLKGGDLRSMGRADEVVEDIKKNPSARATTNIQDALWMKERNNLSLSLAQGKSTLDVLVERALSEKSSQIYFERT